VSDTPDRLWGVQAVADYLGAPATTIYQWRHNGYALRAINPSTIRDWLHGLTMERSYQRTIFANVSQIFAAAIADDLIGKNPCSSKTVRKPTPDPRKVVPWPTEWVAGVRAARSDR
jgi:hypothetical protein